MPARRLDTSLPLNPGNLRDWVVFQRPVKTQNSMGEDVTTSYVPVVSCWCHVRALSGREMEAVQQIWAEARFRVRTWYVSGLQRQDVGFWGDRRLDVLDAEDPDGRGREIVIFARELVA